MKERRGTVGRLAGLAEGVAAAARRRQRERAPRVTLYDAEGEPRLLGAEEPAFEEVVSAAERLLELGGGVRPASSAARERAGESSTGGVSVPTTDLEPAPKSSSKRRKA